MFRKILIANRGEIALRVIRACKELEIKTVVVYSTVDRESLPVQMADEAFCVGPAAAQASYLNIPNIISAALISGADAIHPGYGFLAENEKFVDICESHGIKFIGPPGSSMTLMKDKSMARKSISAAGIPVLPGTYEISGEDEALKFSKGHGFPLIIKAVAGGGGKGIRVVRDVNELLKALSTTQVEAKSAFDDDRIYLEKFLEEPRHIEVQLLADQHGNVVHLGERDCSVQRLRQKLVEESPSQILDDKLRKKMGDAAVMAAKAVGYKSLGTMEFLLDVSTGEFFFMEMNTRIQVEHPVTEMVTGLDLVKAQIKIAAGEKLEFTQEDVRLKGHAIECRINAEDPEKGFLPSTGEIKGINIPGGPGLRVDTHIYSGMKVMPFYDSLMAKVITYGRNREEAIKKMNRALEEFKIEGIKTTIPFHLKILNNAFFREGQIHTNFVEKHFAAIP
ncbi:MAG: acetyl-CoA carboxylase biotin carboxylase subunit [Firmicutes bacterium]|nr:acetyl-CoA carboxylase biotin carboxylase subunit [Bacillota bacterium]